MRLGSHTRASSAMRDVWIRPLECALPRELSRQACGSEKRLALRRWPLFEVLVIERGARRDALARIIGEQRVEQSERLSRRPLPREDGRQLVVRLRAQLDRRSEGQRGVLWPDALVGRAQKIAHHLELLELIRRGHQRSVEDEFSKDATDGPHVDCEAVCCGTQQEFRRSVPECNDASGVFAFGGLDRAREAEVAEFKGAVRGEEQVGELEVAVKHSVRMQVCNGIQQLLRQAFYLCRREGCRHSIEQPCKIVLAELEDEEERIKLRANDHVKQRDHVRVAQPT
mmetsp:Transcript_24937/g.53862  ORF Transcript_24937/g.53862 Transcript_24937/m.53862 type:complete len:284 (-) Transcript_24937:214-1065(-)